MEWLAKDYVLSFKNNEGENIELSDLKLSDKMSRPSKSLIDIDLYKKCNQNKEKISLFPQWETLSVFPFSRIPKIFPKAISEDYFKLYEILKWLDIKDIKTSMHLGEAPGAFIQALVDLFPNVQWKAQTLKDGIDINPAVDVPENWSFGDITTDDIQCEKNICLLTADALWDTSFDPLNQEQHMFQLIFSEVYHALKFRARIFICRIYDSHTTPTAQLIYILTKVYQNVYIIKPRTTKPTNSEKFIVCENMIGSCDIQKISQSFGNQFCRDLGIQMDENFTQKLFHHNNKLLTKQIENIEKVFDNICVLDVIQNKCAIEFCEKFDIIPSTNYKHHTHYSKDNGLIKLCNKCFNLYA